MSATTLNLDNLELVSTLRNAPLNGPPSSNDFNDGEQEKLTDLTTLATFVNNVLLPMLSTLAPESATGIEGSNIYGDSTSEEVLFYNTSTGVSLSMADSLRLLFGQLQTLQTQQGSTQVQVGQLQARLSSTNQNDIALALQGFTSTLNSQLAQIRALQLAVSSLQIIAGTNQDAQVDTPTIGPDSIETVTLLWQIPFASDSYTVSYGTEDTSGFLEVTGFTYIPGGTGVHVSVFNSDLAASHQGKIHAIARLDSLTS